MQASILVPVRNGAKYLTQALDSIALATPGTPYEIVVQDSLSTDGTRDIVESYSPAVRYICERDEGQADGLNRALARASGEVIGWLNSDDLYHPNAVTMAVRAFEANPSVDVVFGNWNIIDNSGVVLRRFQPAEWNWHRLYRKGNYIFSGATFLRRRVFERFGLFDTTFNYTMDFEFYLRIGKGVSARFVNAPFGTFRIHNESKSGREWRRFVAENTRVRRQYLANGQASVFDYTTSQAISWAAGAAMSLRYSKTYSRLRSRQRTI